MASAQAHGGSTRWLTVDSGRRGGWGGAGWGNLYFYSRGGGTCCQQSKMSVS